MEDKSSLAELSDDEWLKRESNACSRLCNQLERLIQKNKKITSSALKIQSIQRGRKARHIYKVKQQETQAAVKIQTIHRGRSVRSKQMRERNKILEKPKSASLRKARRTGSLHFVKQDIEAVEEKKRQEENYAAIKLQALHRGRSARKQTKKQRTGHNNKRTQPNVQKQGSARVLSPYEMRMKKIAAEEKRILEDSKKYQYDHIASNTEQLQKHDNSRDEAAVKLQALHRGRETRKQLSKNQKKQDNSDKNTTIMVESSMEKHEWTLSPRTMEDKLEALFRFLQQHDQNNSINHGVPLSIPRSKFIQLIEQNQSELVMYLEDEPFLKAFILGTKLPSALTCKYKSMQINVTPKIINELLTIEQASAPTIVMSSEHSNHSTMHTIDHDNTHNEYKKQHKKKKKKKKDKKSKKNKKDKKDKKDKKGKRKRKKKDDEADPVTTADEMIEKHDTTSDSILNDRDDEHTTNSNVRYSNNDTLEVKVEEKNNVTNDTNENLEEEKQVDKNSENNNDDDLKDLEAELALLEAYDANEDEHYALEAELERKMPSTRNIKTAVDGTVEIIKEEINVNNDVLPNTVNRNIGIESHPDFDDFMLELSQLENDLNDVYNKKMGEKESD